MVTEQVEHGHESLVTAPLVEAGFWVFAAGLDLDNGVVSSTFLGDAGSLVSHTFGLTAVVDTVLPGVVAAGLGRRQAQSTVTGETIQTISETAVRRVIFREFGIETSVVAAVVATIVVTDPFITAVVLREGG